MDELLFRRIPETAYLNVERTPYYRAILHFCYVQHGRLRHYLFPEEIHAHLREQDRFADYDEEQLELDLRFLVEHQNLIDRQDTSRVISIRDFKRKKFRYQCTAYTVEIERMVERLRDLGDSFGGSLETTLFDRLLETLDKLTAQAGLGPDGRVSYEALSMKPEALNRLWEDMYGYFRKLGESASDYLAHLKSEKVEERMKTEAFMVYKDAFAEYLRDFVLGLQRAQTRIEAILRNTPDTLLAEIAAKLADYQRGIPRLEEPPPRQRLIDQHLDRWQSLREWFHGHDGRQSEWLALQNETVETIRRITRFAQRLGERLHHARSRQRDYEHLAHWFAGMTDLADAHKLAAVVFGAPTPRHLFADQEPETEDLNARLWDCRPEKLTVKPRIRRYKERTKPGAIVSRQEEKAKALADFLKQKEAERQLVADIMRRRQVTLSELETVDPFVRKTLLNWIGKCAAANADAALTETGHRVRLRAQAGKRAKLTSEDGVLDTPDYELQVID